MPTVQTTTQGSNRLHHLPDNPVTDRDTLLRTVLIHPADDTARLVLADLLRESDDAEVQARGRFLWAGVIASRFRGEPVIDDPIYYSAQEEIATIATAGFPAQWLAELELCPRPLTAGDWAWDNTLDRVSVRVGAGVGTFTRGMLAELTLTLAEWYAVATTAVATWPIESASVADVPGLTFTIQPIGSGWRLSARLRVVGRRVSLLGGIVPAAVAPRAVLDESAADWRVEELFGDWSALVAGVAGASAALVADLREVAADRWPSPPRKR